jgi:hypothetical protein
MNNNNNKSISDLIIEYFKNHPNVDLPHGPVVDWVEEEYKRIYGRKPRDISVYADKTIFLNSW